MPIFKIVEYGICCDWPDCMYGNHVFGCAFSRHETEKAATKEGWLKVSARKWLCPEHAAQLRQYQEKNSSVPSL